jgi:hypothetical protein
MAEVIPTTNVLIQPTLWPFLAFPNSTIAKAPQAASQIYIGFIYPILNTTTTLNNQSITSVGLDQPVTVTIQNYTSEENNVRAFGQPDMTYYSWGLECQVPRERGLHNLTRLPNNTWSIDSSTFGGVIDYPPLQLGLWDVDLKFQAINSSISGFGPAVFHWDDVVSNASDLAYEFDLPTVMLNALYLVGETERIADEVVMYDTAGSTSFSLTGTATVTFYRITYVPILLLGGISFAALASCIPVIMFVYSSRKNTLSFRTWRKVNVIRLVVDAMSGLQLHEGDGYQEPPDNKTLKAWARNLEVEYYRETDSKGRESIKLKEM